MRVTTTIRVPGPTPLLLLATAAVGGCLDDPDPVGVVGESTTVVFTYEAPTETDPQVATDFPGCVSGVGETHLHPAWRSFRAVPMDDVGSDLWRLELSDVPVGIEQRIRVSDPNVCADNPTGASTDGVFANDVLLTRVVPTPGSGTEPGLAFTVEADGTVRP